MDISGPGPVGRDSLLADAGLALTGPGVLLEGPPGIGKTALWQTLRHRAHRAGMLVLSAEPTESEQRLPYAALADVLRPIAALVTGLPAPQRIAAQVVLLSADPADAIDERSVGAATLALLSAVAAQTVLLAVDDAQWLDPPSERALRFALRRLPFRPGLLLAVRSEIDSPAVVPLDLGRLDPPLHRFPLTPLGIGAMHHVLRGHLGVSLSRPLLRRIVQNSAGNPLMAIELARAVLRRPVLPRPDDDLPVVASIQHLTDDAVAALPAPARTAIRLAALLSTPTLTDLVASGLPSGVLDPAEEAGLVQVEPGGVRFSHPLHAAAVRAGIPAGIRRRLQRGLADIVLDPDERARQLARGTEQPDAAVAREVEAAAARQAGRGAPDLAADLFDRAAELTPTGDRDDRSRRLISAVRCHFDSGDHAAAERAAATALDELTGEFRAEALLLRATVAFVTVGHPPAITWAEQALESVSPDRPLAGRIHAHLTVFHDSADAAIGHARAALVALEPPRSPAERDLLCGALFLLFYNEVRAGGPPRPELLDRALELEGATPPWLGGSVPGLWWTAMDQPERAERRMLRHAEQAAAQGDEPLRLEVLLHLVQCRLLAGRWPEAAESLGQAYDLGEQLGAGQDEFNYLSAQLALNRGELAAIGPVIAAGLHRAEELGDSWGRRVHRVLSGQLDLLEHRYAAAARTFGLLADELQAQGLVEPLASRWEPDWIEACVGAGDLTTATRALDILTARHRRLPRPWTALAVARARVLVAAAQGRDAQTELTALAAARADPAFDVLPLDRARSALAAGMAHRRARRKAPARVALTAAVVEFESLGAHAFADQARLELDRLGGRAAAPDELTPTEDRVARLAATGRTNRVIAEHLFISPKTVEANLARAYRKLGITSRAELGSRMGPSAEHGRR